MLTKENGRIKRHRRIRKRIIGTAERPRVCVHRSLKNIYVQVIDDTVSRTIISFSTSSKEFAGQNTSKGKVEAARNLGKFFGKILKDKGILKIAFDRSGYLYHGRIKALADSLREAGIEF